MGLAKGGHANWKHAGVGSDATMFILLAARHHLNHMDFLLESVITLPTLLEETHASCWLICP